MGSVEKLEESPKIATWDKFKIWVTKLVSGGKAYWFRGQADSSWTLKTTFHRESDRTGMTMPKYLELVEGEMHYQISSRLNQVVNLKDTFEYASYLALLRNHGFPSPLLDWTLSPYVAAYFAFRECGDKKPECKLVRVYMFDFDLWRKTYEQITDLKVNTPYVSVIRPYAKYNPRQLAQNTVYTVTNVSDMQEHITSHKKTTSFLSKVDFNADIRNDVIKELDLMGINEMALFPDLDGLCREMKRKYF